MQEEITRQLVHKEIMKQFEYFYNPWEYDI